MCSQKKKKNPKACFSECIVWSVCVCASQQHYRSTICAGQLNDHSCLAVQRERLSTWTLLCISQLLQKGCFQMKSGYLSFNSEVNRIHVSFWDSDKYDLYCGVTFGALIDGRWMPTRIEFSSDWYLVDLFESGNIPVELKVRM